jgi:prevent-host-death family protein
MQSGYTIFEPRGLHWRHEAIHLANALVRLGTITRLTWTTKWSKLNIRRLFNALDGPKEMRISVSEAKGQLTELVRRAEAGDEVVLTRHGHPAVRLVPVMAVPDRSARRALLEAIRKSGATKASAGPGAARSQDFLYGDDGMPK